MPHPPTPSTNRKPPTPTTVLELRVQNHPGAMARITALFADGGFNLEAILCVPLPGGIESRMLLLVSDAHRLGHVEEELARLPDILALRRRADLGPEYFEWMAEMGAGAHGHHR
jgi:acetolactate synthase I/III small subunit